MSEAKKLNITFKKDSKLLQELLDDIKGNPNPIRDYDEDALKFNSLKENNAYRALMQNKKLCAFIEIGSQSPGSIELQVNENELIILKALKENGIIDYPELEEEKEKPDGEKTEQSKDVPQDSNLDESREEKNNLAERIEETNPDENASKQEALDEDKDKKNEEKKPFEQLDTKDEKVLNSPEYLEFTKERLKEQVRNLHLPNTEIEMTILSAYDSATYLSQLQDPKFLENYLSDPDHKSAHGKDVEAKSFGKLHQQLIMNTYVGYVMEENAEVAEDGSSIAVAEFPQMVEDMPQWMKNAVNEEIVDQMKKSIDRIVNSGSSYDALMLIIPIDKVYDRAIEYAEYQSDRGGNSDIKRAYIKHLAHDSKNNIRDEFRAGKQNLEVHINAADIDWTNPRIRREMISLVNRADKEAYNQNIEKLIKNVSFEVAVHSKDDIEELKQTCQDLQSLNVSKEVSVVVETDDPVVKADLSRDVDSTIGKDSDIRNDTYRADNVADSVLRSAISTSAGVAVGAGVASVVQGVAPTVERNANMAMGQTAGVITSDEEKNQRLMKEIAMHGDNPVEYMAALTQEMIAARDEDRFNEYNQPGYTDQNSGQ